MNVCLLCCVKASQVYMTLESRLMFFQKSKVYTKFQELISFDLALQCTYTQALKKKKLYPNYLRSKLNHLTMYPLHYICVFVASCDHRSSKVWHHM